MAVSAAEQVPVRETRVWGMGDRAAALCGVLSVVAGVTGSTVADVTAKGVNPGSPSPDLVAAYVAYSQRLQLGAVLTLVAFVLQLVFLGPLWARLRSGSQRLALVAVVGGASTAAMLWLTSAFLDTAMSTAASYHDDAAARLLLLAGWETARVATAPSVVMIGACVLAGLRYQVLPRWLTGFSIVVGSLCVVGMLPSGPAGGFGLLGGGLWVLVVSGYLTLARSAPAPRPADRGSER